MILQTLITMIPTGYDCYVCVQKCCYDRNVWMWSTQWETWSWMWTWVRLGSLITDELFEAGGFCYNNPLFNSTLSADEDKNKEFCCGYSFNCNFYYAVRPIKTCAGFVPPVIRMHLYHLTSVHIFDAYGDLFLLKRQISEFIIISTGLVMYNYI
jgi:hypothetical protein